MTIAVDDEILQDFMVEAGELLEHLGEQLVDLEQRPHDMGLLNAVFRAFHTIKGGGGFLNLTAMVEACHQAEDVFNCLRQGQREVDADLMDAVLQVLDSLNGMFSQLRRRESLSPASPALLKRLQSLALPAAAVPSSPQPSARPSPPPPPVEAAPRMEAVAAVTEIPDDITDAEFEALLDALHNSPDSATDSALVLLPHHRVEKSDEGEETESVGGDHITED